MTSNGHRKAQMRTIFWLILVGIMILNACQFRRSMTGLFFGVKTGPVKLPLKDNYEPRKADAKTTQIVLAAQKFINSLNASQKKAILYSFSDNAQRANWSNFPEGMIPRGGLKLAELSKQQRYLLEQLLSVIFSEKGVQNIKYQLAAEDSIGNSTLLKYGSKYFYVAFLGEPSKSMPWMFQFGGHHLGINTTFYGQDVTFSPMHTGAQPVNIVYQGKKISITEKETRTAQSLLESLTDEQKEVAIRGEEAIDMVLGPGEFGTTLPPEGIKGSNLSKYQKQLLIKVIRARLDFINENDNAALMVQIQAELDDTYFAWWGPQKKLGFAYFRITGPSVVMEYAPQDDENDAGQIDHVHSIYLNPQNDYGSIWIRRSK